MGPGYQIATFREQTLLSVKHDRVGTSPSPVRKTPAMPAQGLPAGTSKSGLKTFLVGRAGLRKRLSGEGRVKVDGMTGPLPDSLCPPASLSSVATMAPCC